MLSNVISLFLWKDYFDKESPSKSINDKITTSGYENVFKDSIFFNNCFIYDISSNRAGCAIHVENITNFMVESTTFLNCTTTGDNGAVYYRSTAGSKGVYNKICSSGCFCILPDEERSYGQSIFQALPEGYSAIYESSFIEHKPKTGNTRGILCFYYSNSSVNTCNETNNILSARTVIDFLKASDIRISYCSYICNEAPKASAIYFNNCTEIYMGYCNIIQTKAKLQLISLSRSGIMTIENTCFLFNTYQEMFKADEPVQLVDCSFSEMPITCIAFIKNVTQPKMNGISFEKCNFDPKMHKTPRKCANRYNVYKFLPMAKSLYIVF